MITEKSKNYNFLNVIVIIITVVTYNLFSTWFLDFLFVKYWGYFIGIFISVGMLGVIIPGTFYLPYVLIVEGRPKYNLPLSIAIFLLTIIFSIFYFDIFRFDFNKIFIYLLIIIFSNAILINGVCNDNI